MAKHIKCGRVFSGIETNAQQDQTIVVEGDTITYVGASAGAPAKTKDDETIDFGSYLVFPGLIDVHTHLTYGNAMCEEDIDLYAPIEFRALRGLINAQRLIGAGYTSMADPGGSTRVAVSIRDAINAGLFKGPRITCSGAYITSRQGLTDWYPSWFGQPETSIGHLVRNIDEAIEEVYGFRSKTASISSNLRWMVASEMIVVSKSRRSIKLRPRRSSVRSIGWERKLPRMPGARKRPCIARGQRSISFFTPS